MFEGEGNEGGAPRLTTSGADESRLYMFDVRSRREEDRLGQCSTKTSATSGIVTQQDRAAGLRAFIRRGESDPTAMRDLTAAPLFPAPERKIEPGEPPRRAAHY
jgi:hypothetical protein